MAQVNLNGSKAQPGVQPKYLPNRDIAVISTVTPTQALANDLWTMLTAPGGATITSISLDSDKLDSNGTPAIKLDVGDGTTANKYIAASTVAQQGGVVYASTAAAVGTFYAANTALIVKVNTSAATFQAGTLRLCVTYTMDP